LPDGAMLSGLTRATAPTTRFRQRWVSPLLRRILLVNALPLALLVVALLYLDQYQNGLLEAQVTALREQARVFAGALGESAVRTIDPDNPKLVSEVAASLLRRLTEPTPDAQARLYAPDGTILADSRQRAGPGGTVTSEPLPPPPDHGRALAMIGWVYDRVLGVLPHAAPTTLVDITPSAGGPDWQPNVKEELRLSSAGNSNETLPYIRRTRDNRLLVTVAVPVERDKHTVGIISLTREAREVDESLFSVRMSILALFGLALGLTVLLSWYLSLTIARPILRLAEAAADPAACRPRSCGGAMRSGRWPPPCRRRRLRCGSGWTRPNASPRMWPTRSRTRCRRSAAPSRPSGGSRIRAVSGSC
jgi:two-component system, OmpR family, sensor histidine kinase ChvG